MTKSTSPVDFLDRAGKSSTVPKFARRMVRRLEIVPAFVVILLIAPLAFIPSPIRAHAKPQEESQERVEGFSLVRYEEELTWKLTGEKAGKGNGDLVVSNFELLVRRAGAGVEKSLYEFSGKELRLNSEAGAELATIPEEVKIKIQDEFRGEAESARYDFSSGKVSGTELKLTRTGAGEEISLNGKSFEYSYKSEELSLIGGFRATVSGYGERWIEISGDQLTRSRDEVIFTRGNVVARTEGGWKLSGETMRWNPEKKNLECFGTAEAVKGDTKVQGESLTYSGKEEKLRVNGAILVVKGD
ncbi:MAG: hypothetical protein V5A77_08040 [Candidatus Bipolaricaulota bacterium]